MRALQVLRRLGKIQSLGEARRLAHCLVFSAAVPLMMRMPLPRLDRVLESRLAGRRTDSENIDQVIRDVNRVLRYGRPLVRRGCVTRALTRYYFLRRAGANVRLCFGARLRDGKFEAHCWLERAGEPFLEPVAEWGCAFKRFYTLPCG